MSEQVLRNGNAMARSKTRTVTQIAMLGAIAGILMNLEFPLPFLAPTFYQLDFSEIPVLVGSFAMGPIAGVLIELVKILVHLVTKGSMTAGVGDVANFIFGCTFAVPAGLIYRYKSVKSRKHAVIGMAVGTVLTAVVAWENDHCCKCKKIIYRTVYCTSHFNKCFYRHSKSLSVCRK